METLLTAIITAVTTLLAAVGAYFTARKMGRLGIGPAQQRLTETLTDLNDAYEDRIQQLESQVSQLETENTDLRKDLQTYRRENLRLKQELHDLRDEVRELRRAQTPEA